MCINEDHQFRMISCTIQHIGLDLSFPVCTVNLLLTAPDRISPTLSCQGHTFLSGNAPEDFRCLPHETVIQREPTGKTHRLETRCVHRPYRLRSAKGYKNTALTATNVPNAHFAAAPADSTYYGNEVNLQIRKWVEQSHTAFKLP